MRILYVAGNRKGSYQQLKRYLPLFKTSKHTFKIAGYRKSLQELSADYCLDALINFTKPNINELRFNGNFNYYIKELNKFSPDLIISDFDLYTSIYATDKNIPLWQVSSVLLNYSLSSFVKVAIGSIIFNRNLYKGHAWEDYSKIIFKKSDKKLVLSHFCDFENRPKLEQGFEWVRPEFQLKEDHKETIVSDGTTYSTADAFYNEQYALFNIPENDIEIATNVCLGVYYKTGQLEDDQLEIKKPKIKIDQNTKFLMELL